MTEYTITVEKIETYKIISDNEDDALDKAEEMFNKADAMYYIDETKSVFVKR